ncbi:nickel ABC transporter permease subunit NikC [Brevibacillus laterosporus]|uniref:nickel ABC transporter permease subunit NikC n=1 Tax=Brevibacillus laterosporus TaxID=1465 RepID=UPI00037E202D|nr:nickel ABC transporter permease subunit NikC [Brevibacillus laterosporus]ATO47701.1 nickel ABC transporter permease subunit NikC [Brevibacillus laterosporus DSM 25]MBG9804778.1 nickel transporter permease NikC [Brevibacillus laterosporus]MED2002563.1 nickel ABC transporter permease subunit NikC [Brevibacillus laterosporus]MED4761956.1 nickel ABC transporter permease subunit NikC [Brevibacillus laterosporus]TPH23006.1 nickel ABC transporter permease subunit NikC [Brevibacillus laterosporus]
MLKNLKQKLLSQKLMIICSIIIFLMILLALFAPFWSPNDPNLVDITHKLQGPSATFPLGTDHLGRCIWSRLIYGTRTSLGTAFLIMGLTMTISIPIGIYAGFRGGWVDYLFMRICDILMAFPNLLLSLALIGILGPGLGNLILAMVLVQWVFYARIIRGMVLSVKEQHFILAAKVCGTPKLVIVLKHILPTIISQIVVLAFMDIGGIVLAISGLSFLGLGIQPPEAEWGMMINDSKPFFRNNPSLMLYPGMMILLVVIAFNLFGEALRDALDLRRK